MSSSLRVMPMYRAASRSFVILGCEREPVLLLIIYCFSLIFIGLSFVTTVLGLSLWFIGLFILRRFAKNDPRFFMILRRHFFLYRQEVYLPFSRPGAKSYRGRS